MDAVKQLDDLIRLSLGIPIEGIADLGNGEYRIDFKPEATEQQQQAAWAVLANFAATEPPNWDQFRAQTLIHSAYLRIVTHNPITLTLNTVLVALLWDLGKHPQMFPDVINTWNAIAIEAQPTPAEIRVLNQIAVVCHMPFRLNEFGLMLPQ